MDKYSEIVNVMNKDEKKPKCPSCGSEDSTVLEILGMRFAGSNVGFLVFGLVVIGMFLVMEKPDEFSDQAYMILQLGAVYMIIMLIWNGALNQTLPIPLLGNLFGRTFEIKAECSGCGNQWEGNFRF